MKRSRRVYGAGLAGLLGQAAPRAFVSLRSFFLRPLRGSAPLQSPSSPRLRGEVVAINARGGSPPPRSLRSLPLCSDEIQWRSIQSARAARRARPFTRNPSIPASPPPSPPPYPPPLLRGEGEKIQIYYPQVYPLFAFDALAYFADYKEMTSRDNSASGHKSTLELDPTRPMSDHAR